MGTFIITITQLSIMYGTDMLATMPRRIRTATCLRIFQMFGIIAGSMPGMIADFAVDIAVTVAFMLGGLLFFWRKEALEMRAQAVAAPSASSPIARRRGRGHAQWGDR